MSGLNVRKACMGGLFMAAVGFVSADSLHACGGFFCQQVPIDQAGEQIIFRQDGGKVTAVVLILYQGNAEDFSWVVPAPGIPQLSVGSDLVFGPLEQATRPQFILDQTGPGCEQTVFPSPATDGANDNAVNEDGSGVEVLQRLSVGPFDVQIVTSDDPDALAAWLTDNGYDLTDRGRGLIAPYVEEGMNFVAMRLRQDQGVGDIQPLIMEYESSTPVIPIRLTAVAAMPDMGVLVWLLGPSRAVPLNYLHVTPNYTRLNWYAGTFNAYAGYQGLITAAMNEAGGQGFATDYAGRDIDVLAQLPTVESLSSELARLSGLFDDAEFIAELASNFVFPQDQVLELLRRILPLPEGNDEFIYQVPELLEETFTPEQLAEARTTAVGELNTTVIQPLEATLSVLGHGDYMTRLYTTLSPEEMTLDPVFSFNPDLGDQSLERRATLDSNCTGWTLTLGPGTGRDGELVIRGSGPPPGFSAPAIQQDAVWRTETTSTSGQPNVVTQKQFDVVRVTSSGGTGGQTACGAGTPQCGAGTAATLALTMLGLRLMRGRRRS